jgi:thiol-disulfide isomerase/thioredoxin
MGGSRAEVLLLLLTGIVLLLMVAIIGLFLRMNQLQREVLAVLEPLRPAQPPAGLSPGTQAPAFTLPDLSGRSVSLEALAGQRVLLAFASPHCPACREMYPHLRAFAEEHPDQSLTKEVNDEREVADAGSLRDAGGGSGAGGVLAGDGAAGGGGLWDSTPADGMPLRCLQLLPPRGWMVSCIFADCRSLLWLRGLLL